MNIRDPKSGRYTTGEEFVYRKPAMSERLFDFFVWIGDSVRFPFRKLYDFIQRGKRGYADADLMDFDFYLSNMLSKAIWDLRKETMSFPVTKSVKHYQDWLNVLAHISRGFKSGSELQERGFTLYGNEKKNKRLQREWESGSMLFIKYFWHLWL